MSSTIIIATAIVTINPTVEAERIALEYAYYQADPLTQARQADHDATIEVFGGTRIDLAWAKAMDRAQRRAMPKTADMLAQFRAQVEIDRFARAMAQTDDAPIRAIPAPAPISWDTEGTPTDIVMPVCPVFPEDFQF